MRKSKKTMAELTALIDKNLSRYATQIERELILATPKDTGTARSGWKRPKRGMIGKGKRLVLLQNRVPYIEYLDAGHSKQAPNGIVAPVLKRFKGRKR